MDKFNNELEQLTEKLAKTYSHVMILSYHGSNVEPKYVRIRSLIIYQGDSNSIDDYLF